MDAAPVTLSTAVAERNQLDQIAARRLGLTYLFPYQRLVICNLLAGRSQIVVLPTGAGKSLCFTFPAVLLRGVTLVVVPLLALIADLERRIAAAGIAVDVLRGGQPAAQRARLLQAMRDRRLRLVLTTPEAALAPRTTAALATIGAIEHLVIDEAHCVTEWGDSFRPAYLRLGELVSQLRPRQLTAFTATATPAVLRRLRQTLFVDRSAHLVAGNPDRPNIRYEVQATISPLRRLTVLAATRVRPLLAFARSRRVVEAVAGHLQRRLPAIPCRFYHAGLSHQERAALEQWFLRSSQAVLVSTSAYGMGVDKPDIRTVLHLAAPASVESYLQETGRAGRDRAPAGAVLLTYLLDGGAVAAGSAHRRAPGGAQLHGYGADAGSCRRAQLLQVLQQERVECSGCDVCDGAVRPLPQRERRLLAALARGSRRYTLRQWLHIFAGRPTFLSARDHLSRAPGYGLLRRWDSDEIGEACDALVAAGAARVPARGPFRGRLVVSRAVCRQALGPLGV